MDNELMRKYINILEDSSESNLSQLWATYAVNSCILGNLGKAGATGGEDGHNYRSENERLLGIVSRNVGPEIADKLKKWSDYLILFPSPNNEFFCCDGWGRRLVSGMVTSVI